MNILLFRIKCLLSLVVYPFILCSKNKGLIIDEMRTYERVLCLGHYKANVMAFVRIFAGFKEFRTLVLYRLSDLGLLLQIFIPTQSTLTLITPSKNIGQGLVFHHGYSTVVFAERIGRNCQIWHNVTIGRAHHQGALPIIEDNVKVCAGAVVLGNVTVGKNAIIAANAVVVKDVPENCIVAGNPAKIIKANLSISETF